MRIYSYILIITIFVLTGCVTYEDGEPVQDEAYEERQKEDDKEKEKEENTTDEKKDKDLKNTNKEDDISIDKFIKEENEDVTDADLYDEGMLIIKIDADGSFSENTLVTNQAYKILEIMKLAFSDDEVLTVDAVVRVTMADNKGNESLSDAVNVVYTRDSFEELNYDEFSKLARTEEWRVYNESDEYLINPGIYEKLKNEIKNNLTNGSSKFE